MAKQNPTGLNDQQMLFCQLYVKYPNASRAYKAAYPDSSLPAARSSSADLLINPNVLAYIEELKQEMIRNSKVTREQVVNELATMGFSNLDISSLSHTDKLKALADLSKILGYINGSDSSKSNTNDVDSELSRSVAGSRSKVSKRGTKS